jgi:hypothetical protein
MDVIKFIHKIFQPPWVRYPADWKICARCGQRLKINKVAVVFKFGKWYHLSCAHRYSIIRLPGSDMDGKLVQQIGSTFHDPKEDIDPEVEDMLKRRRN